MDAVIAWKSGTIVDATIIAAPSSTKNAAKARGVRYRGLAKNLAHAYTVFALANLCSVRQELLPAGCSVSCRAAHKIREYRGGKLINIPHGMLAIR